jgi:hypothetical protein
MKRLVVVVPRSAEDSATTCLPSLSGNNLDLETAEMPFRRNCKSCDPLTDTNLLYHRVVQRTWLQ